MIEIITFGVFDGARLLACLLTQGSFAQGEDPTSVSLLHVQLFV